MASRILQRLTLAAVLASGMGLVLAHAATAAPLPGVRRTARPTAARGFNLFAGVVQLTINANRVQCGMNNIGEQCVDATNSPTLGGGFWPKGSPDQYNFNGGLQMAAVIPGTRATFAWSGDTVGAYFFDGRGDQTVGSGVTNMFSSNVKDDMDNWPSAAYVQDPTLYHPSLLGRKAMSQQDTWVRYWDGNVNLLTGRAHPMGILVDQRTMAWNFPTGNQDIIYFVERFINITATDPTRYDSLAQYGYSASDIADIVQIARNYHDAVQAKFGVTIPDTGYQLTRFYAGPEEDPDVVAGGSGNYSTANLVFSMDFAYHGVFYAPTQQYPSDIFFGPWAPVPGFQGNKFLKGPADAAGHQIGITMFTNTTNGGVFPDRFGSQALWRLASNNLLPVDGQCNVPINTPMCAAVQSQADSRMYIFSGPLTINPGQSQVVVFADVYAAAYGPAIQNDGAGHLLGSTAFDMKPGFPGTPGGYVSTSSRVGQVGLDTLRMIDRATGWNSAGPDVSALDADGNGTLEQTEIPVIKGSLLDKALVAQAVFDASFLLPYAPDAPPFYLVPGDNQVTVAWQPSATEDPANGDPYYAVASQPLSPLYDQDYRSNDVEGYRIYRGRTQSQLTLIAQFDYSGTSILDYTGQFTNADYGAQCAPELGVTGSCPSDLATGHAVSLVGNVVQIGTGNRAVLQSGDVLITKADTAVTGDASGFPALTDNGVPFAYVDNTVRNGFRYFYAVTAFDINSVKSGPSSLESARVTKEVTPRVLSTNNTPAAVVVGIYGSDTTQLNPNASWPDLDPATGTFNGIIPPTNAGDFGFLASVAEALPPGEYVAKIDSITGGIPASLGTEPTMYMTFSAPGVTQHFTFTTPFPGHSDAPSATNEVSIASPLVPYDTMRSRLVGIPLSFSSVARMPVNFSLTFVPIVDGAAAAMLCGRGLVSATNCGSTIQGSRYLLHSRFWDAGSSEPPDPTVNFNPSPDHNSGTLTGVTNIWAPLPYRTPLGTGGVTRAPATFRYYAYALTAFHPADYLITWGAGGAVTIRDSTHHTDLPFRPDFGPGYGFISGAAIAAAGVTSGRLTLSGGGEIGTPSPSVPSYHSIYTVGGVCDGSLIAGGFTPPACVPLSQTAVLQGLDWSNPADGVADANGIVMVINGETFFLAMAALPAAGTAWRFRALGGLGMTATCTPALPAGTGELVTPPTDCGTYAYTPRNSLRQPMVPGLQYKIVVQQPFSIAAASGDISRVHTVPDPYYVTNALEITSNTKVLRFVNLPDRAIIRIYSVSGILVNILTHNDMSGGGEEVWNLRNRNNQFVASGVYFYHVETPDGQTKIGRFTVVNYAQ